MKQRSFAPAIPMPAFNEKESPIGVTTPVPALGVPADAPAREQASSAVSASNRRMEMVDVTLIDPNPFAPREVYTADMIIARGESLRLNGQHDPIHVVPNPDAPGRFIIGDGWTRVLACVRHKVLPLLLAEVHPSLSVQDAAWFGYEQNESRQQHCDLDRAQFYEKMRASAGISTAEIARRTGLSKTQLTFYSAFTMLPSEILDLVRAQPEKFGANAAYHLRRVFEACGVRRALSLATKFADESQSVRWLTNQAQAAITPSHPVRVATLKHIRYANGSYRRTDGAFHVDIEVAKDQQDAFEKQLEQLLASVAIPIEKPATNSDS